MYISISLWNWAVAFQGYDLMLWGEVWPEALVKGYIDVQRRPNYFSAKSKFSCSLTFDYPRINLDSLFIWPIPNCKYVQCLKLNMLNLFKLKDLVEVHKSYWRPASAKKRRCLIDNYYFEARVNSFQATILDFCLTNENHKGQPFKQ